MTNDPVGIFGTNLTSAIASLYSNSTSESRHNIYKKIAALKLK
jgi:hypothetical protein